MLPWRRTGALLLILWAMVGASVGTAATNTVPPSHLSAQLFSVTANDLKPPQCAGIVVVNLLVGSGSVTGTNANDLILGGAGADTIRGAGGQDCIVGGAGADSLAGEGGDDVILGGPGNDTIQGGPGYDVCYGGPGWDFVTCESWPDWGVF